MTRRQRGLWRCWHLSNEARAVSEEPDLFLLLVRYATMAETEVTNSSHRWGQEKSMMWILVADASSL